MEFQKRLKKIWYQGSTYTSQRRPSCMWRDEKLWPCRDSCYPVRNFDYLTICSDPKEKENILSLPDKLKQSKRLLNLKCPTRVFSNTSTALSTTLPRRWTMSGRWRDMASLMWILKTLTWSTSGDSRYQVESRPVSPTATVSRQRKKDFRSWKKEGEKEGAFL